jgi:hypothetical protein
MCIEGNKNQIDSSVVCKRVFHAVFHTFNT